MKILWYPTEKIKGELEEKISQSLFRSMLLTLVLLIILIVTIFILFNIKDQQISGFLTLFNIISLYLIDKKFNWLFIHHILIINLSYYLLVSIYKRKYRNFELTEQNIKKYNRKMKLKKLI